MGLPRIGTAVRSSLPCDEDSGGAATIPERLRLDFADASVGAREMLVIVEGYDTLHGLLDVQGYIDARHIV